MIRNKQRFRLTTLMLAIVMVVLTACGGANNGNNTTTPIDNGNAAGANNSLNVQIEAAVSTMDPQIVTDGTSFEVIAATLEGLYNIDAAGNPVPAMVETAQKSDDGLEYLYTLKDAQWSNGDPVTAHDFVFAWQRLVDPDTKSEYNYIMATAGVKNAEAVAAGKLPVDELGITAIDDKTLRVELDIPVPFFESLVNSPSFYPMNQAFFESVGGMDGYGKSADTMIANGAFKVADYQPSATTVTLVKNPNYYNADAVKLDGIKYQVTADAQQAMMEFTNGELDITYLTGEQVDMYLGDPQFSTVLQGYLWYISPNLKVKGLDNIHVRRALAWAIDKRGITNNILKDGSEPADWIIPLQLAIGPTGHDFRADVQEVYPAYDPVKAREEWDAAKQELGVDSLTFDLMIEDNNATIKMAQSIQADLVKNLPGLTINLEQMPRVTRLDKERTHDYELTLTRWGADYADPMTFLDLWLTGSSNNNGSWSNAAYDEQIISAQRGELAKDPALRWTALQAAEKTIMDEQVVIPLYQQGRAMMIQTNVHGFVYHSAGIGRVYTDVSKGE